MKKLDLFIEKVSDIIPGRLFGLFSIISGILGDVIAFLMFPSYNFLRRAVSDLCLGPGGLFFNLGNVFSGIFAFVFVNYLGNTFNEGNINPRFRRTAIICANISCVCFIFLGIFCGSNIIIAYIHGISAITSIGFGFCYITFYNILIIRDSKYSRSLGYFGFTVSFIFSLLISIFFLHILPNLRFLMVVLPLLEWLNTISLIIWYIIIPLYMIYKKI
ncbi:MAG: hypothetical protein ACFFCV_10690 [Promethearchaeota archaeon]